MSARLFHPWVVILATAMLAASSASAVDIFSRGDIVRLTRRETLQFNGKNLVTVRKGGEFAVLTQDAARLYVEFYKDDGTLIAASLAKNAVERGATPSPAAKILPQWRTPAARAVMRGRQAMALRRLIEAAKILDAGLAAEPQNAELKTMRARVTKDTESADEYFASADKFRAFGHEGVVHALDALADGLLLCSDHPWLLALKKEMQAEFDKRTSPLVTSSFLSIAKPQLSKEELIAARTLYTERCTGCHDLEPLASRPLSGWQQMVAMMSRRANLTSTEQTRVLEYLTAALKVVEAAQRE